MRFNNFSPVAMVLAATLTVGPAGAQESQQSPLMEDARFYFEPIPAEPPELPGNELTPAKVELGKMLFFDPRLSKSQFVSCNSCHVLGLGGTDGRDTSLGHRWELGGRNAPTVLNAVFNVDQFWDGRAEDLEDQAGGPMENPIEMGFTHEGVVNTLRSMPGYVEAFKKAFPDEENPVTIGNTKRAIAAFEATLITPNAPFDRFLEGEADALSEQQKRGLRLFIDSGCVSCHNGVNAGGEQYMKFGVVEAPAEKYRPPADLGREEVTGDEADRYVYKVPSLRNIALTAPYFHTGQAWTLEEAISVMGKTQLGIAFSDEEIADIKAFLESLTGEQPKVDFPILPARTAETPKGVE